MRHATLAKAGPLDLDEFYVTCEDIAGPEWDYFDEWYSFQHAWEHGMTPEQAVQDCKNWLDA